MTKYEELRSKIQNYLKTFRPLGLKKKTILKQARESFDLRKGSSSKYDSRTKRLSVGNTLRHQYSDYDIFMAKLNSERDSITIDEFLELWCLLKEGVLNTFIHIYEWLKEIIEYCIHNFYKQIRNFKSKNEKRWPYYHMAC